MAHDACDSEVLLEELRQNEPGSAPEQPGPLPDTTTSDTRPHTPGCNPAPIPAGDASHSVKNSITSDDQGYRYIKPKLRTLPAWIRSADYTEREDEPGPSNRRLPSPLHDAVVAQHNHSPHEISRLSDRIERLDAGPENYIRRESRWKSFSKAIAYPNDQGAEEKFVSTDWLNENMGDYSTPWRTSLPSDENSGGLLKPQRRREVWFRRLRSNLLRSPIVPLILRLTVWCLSVAALAIGGSIQHLSSEYSDPQGPSALMAIIVDAVAMVYLIYITWDEYSSKPLGLRSPAAKARLILLDIFFIVFDSANLSLAFESLSSVRGSCTSMEINREIRPKNNAICERQKALASILLVALVAWLMTFSISVLRLVERVTK